jgi:hypothetical protein
MNLIKKFKLVGLVFIFIIINSTIFPLVTKASSPSTPVPEPKPIQLKGQGDDVSVKFVLEEGVSIITMNHDGKSNFIVQLINENGDLVDLLVNETGFFKGSEAIGVRKDNFIGAKPGAYIVNVTADGNWEILIEQPRSKDAKSLPITFKGKSYGVSSFFVLNEGLTTFKMNHDGKSNFIITLLDNNGKLTELLVNETGSYSGKKAIGVKKNNFIGAKPGIYILSVIADGNWSISIKPL